MSQTQINLRTSNEKMTSNNIIVFQTHQKSQLKIEAERNFYNPKTIDHEVLISGFLSEPEPSHWIDLINVTEIDVKRVKNHDSFQGHNGKFFITIGFKNKTSQELFVKNINKQNLEIFDEPRQATTKLAAHKRLTKFNSSVEKELKDLRNRFTIDDFKLNGYLFQAKLNSSSPWITIDTKKALETFTSEAKRAQENYDYAERKANLKDQQDLDCQISIQGFSSKPKNVVDLVTKFMKHFKLSIDQVENYTTESTNNTWSILIKLSTKSAVKTILSTKNKKIRSSYLMGCKDLTDINITWKRVLTKFNQDVSIQLRQAREQQKIWHFEYADHSFRVKVDKFSSFVPIECYSNLDLVLKPKRQQVKTVRKTSLYKANSVESLSTSMGVMSVSGSRK